MKLSFFSYGLMLYGASNCFAGLTIGCHVAADNQKIDFSQERAGDAFPPGSPQEAFQALMKNNRSALVAALDENKKSINALFEGKTLLHWALLRESSTDPSIILDLLDIIDVLLSRGIGISIGDTEGDTVLHYCITYNHEVALKYIFSHRTNPPPPINWGNNQGLTALYYCIDKAKADSLCRLLLEHGASTDAADSGGNTVLHRAAEKGLENHTQLLLAWKAYPSPKDSNDQTPLHKAVRNNHLSMVKLLPRTPDDICAEDRQGKSPLYYAIEKNLKYISSLLLQAEDRIAEQDDKLPCINRVYDELTLLHRACEHNSRSIARLLLQRGADVNALTRSSNSTPLQSVVTRTDDIDLLFIELLLNAGADINITNNRGESVLHLSVKRNLEKLTKLLIEKKASVNAQTDTGETPLYLCIASPSSNRRLCSLLLEHNADPNLANILGETPLHKAAQEGMLDNIALLLRYGADPSANNRLGETPLDFAINNQQEGAKKLLYQATLPVHKEPGSHNTSPLNLLLPPEFHKFSLRNSDGFFKAYYTNQVYHLAIAVIITFFVMYLVKKLNFPKYKQRDTFSRSHWSALHQACFINDFNAVKSLLERGADSNAQLPVSGKTGLMIASEKGYEEICDLFIRQPRLNPALRDPIVGTAMEWACEFERVSICRKLLAGPWRNITTQEKTSLKKRAALNNNLELEGLFS